jgi:GMP synthase-like glutamine amidotransferase
MQPGRIADYLDAHAIPWELVAIDHGEPIPQGVDDVSALVFLGGTMDVNDAHPWLAEEIELIRTAAARNLPMLGHCLGSQLIAKALGANVAPMAAKEIGWHRMRRLDNPVARDWLGAVPESFELLTWHHDAFALPAGAAPLYSSEYCAEQAYAIGNTVATVAHPEATSEMLQEWLQIYGFDIEADSAGVQPIGQIRERLTERCATMHRVFSDRLYDVWIARVRAYGRRAPAA